MERQNQPWQPTEFIRFNRALNTSPDTASIITDQGPAYIKALGNRTGPHILAAELVGTQLAKLLGLPTFDFAIMNVSEDDEIPLKSGRMAEPGPAFVTREETRLDWDGSAKMLAT